MQPETILGPEWKRGTNGNVSAISMTPDASFVAAGCEDHDVYLMNYSGKLLWASTTGDTVQFVKSPTTACSLSACSMDNIVSYFNKTGELLWSFRIGKRINALDMTPDGNARRDRVRRRRDQGF